MSDLSDRVGRIEGELNHLATKSDLVQVEARMKAELAEVKAELAEVKTELLVQIASIEGQLSILIWAIPIAVAIVSLLMQWAAPYLFQRKSQT